MKAVLVFTLMALLFIESEAPSVKAAEAKAEGESAGTLILLHLSHILNPHHTPHNEFANFYWIR